jgi:hypothetical protein
MDLNSILGGLAPIAGGALGGAFGGPIGGFLGSAGGNLLGQWFNGGQQNNQQQQMNQNPAFYDQLQQAQSGLLSQLQQRPQFQPVDINPYLQGARQEFNQQIVPGIAERFSGMGQGGQRSSAFRNSLGAAGSGLAQKLAELQTSHAQDQQGRMMQNQGMDMQRMGMLGNLINQQNQLGQNQNQFNQQQNSWLPYINAGLNAAGIAGNYISGNQNRQQNALQQQTGIANNAQNSGLGRQFNPVKNPGQQGFGASIPGILSGGVKAYIGS